MTLSITHTTPADGTFSTTGAAAWDATHSLGGVADISQGGTNATTAAGARTSLGLGTIATQDANAVAVTGGTINGTTVGATTVAAGSFSTLNSSGATRLGGLSGNQSLQVNNVASAVNYAQVVGAVAGQYAALTTQGADANVGLLVNTKGTYPVTINSALEINPTASSVNFISFYGAVTGGAPVFVAKGSDANVAMGFATKGTQGFAFYTNNFGAQQAAITHTASAVNYLNFTGAATGAAPTISAAGSDTNISLALTAKGTGGHTFNTGGGQQFAVTHTASAVDYLQATGNSGGFPNLSAQGASANVSIVFGTKGTGSHNFTTNGTSVNQFVVAHTASAVNNVRVTGGATGVSPTISAQGSDTNIDLNLFTKGTGVLRFGTYTAGVLSPTGFITITDAAGTSRRLLVG